VLKENRVKKLLVLLTITVVHLSAVIATALATFELSGVFFGVYPPPNDALWHKALTKVHSVLVFPVGTVAVAQRWNPPSGVEWVLMVFNSFLWAGALYFIFRVWRKRRGGMEHSN
jgi:hypothetical protein